MHDIALGQQQFGEVGTVLAGDADHTDARAVALAAHQALVATADGDNFWLGGWLRDQITGLSA